MRMVTTLVACAALAAAALACDTTADRNGNSAIVIHNTNAGAANANSTPAGADRPLNANMSREEFERDKDYYEREAQRLGRTVGRGADDLWLWSKTRAALAAADDIRDLTIDVDVDNNVVTLTGTVATDAQKGRAEQVARGVEGVREVKNSLTVRPL